MRAIKIVILAGGQGARFWPVSRRERPKQFLSISPDGESLIQATARRNSPLSGKENLWIVTNAALAGITKEHVPYAKVITEPVGRNTAASIGLAAVHLNRENPKAVMVVLPADHAVQDEMKLVAVLNEAASVAAKHDLLVTVGIEPTFPHTGYGYIKRGAHIEGNGYIVSRFYEKPNLQRARAYYESREFYWNSGMFVWRAEVILKAFAEFMPQLYQGLMKVEAAIGTKDEERVVAEFFESAEAVSIDFGVLEHARNCAVIAAEPFGWNDVGSWDAWAEHFRSDARGNVAKGEALLIDSQKCVVYSEERLIAVLGGEGLVVIDSGDALLVCPRSRVQDVRQIVEELKKQGKDQLI